MNRSKFIYFQIFFTILFTSINADEENPKVITTEGQIQGIKLYTFHHNSFYAFLGIPYAQAPIGILRFKKPKPVLPWKKVLLAYQNKNACPQLDSSKNIYGSEDCLFLNVFSPITKKSSLKSKYPVMVFIHAESFENGDGSFYRPEKLIDQNVIVVTFNYRLGVFGFLSTEDENAPGNLGLYDQNLALRWIKQNIAQFGGDPNDITLFGQGAGAACVFFHLISPLSKNLFNKAIMQSGSGLCSWALERHPLDYAQEIAKRLYCPLSPTFLLVYCLTNKSVSNLLIAQSKGKIFGEFPQRTAPIIEHTGKNVFLPEEPKILLSKTDLKNFPIIMGLNLNETAYFYPLIVTNYYPGHKIHSIKILVSRFLDATTSFKNFSKEDALSKIIKNYFTSENMSNADQIVNNFIQMSTDSLYVSCVDETLKRFAKNGAKAFMYSFEYRGTNSMIYLLKKHRSPLLDTVVCHGDELLYLFYLKFKNFKPFSHDDEIMSKRLVTLWTSFAKFGNPTHIETSEFPKWEIFDFKKLTYYRIGSKLSSEKAYKQLAAHFWSNYLNNLYEQTSASLIQLNTKKPIYRTLAWAMIGVSFTLLLLVIILLVILFIQRKKSSFLTRNSETVPNHLVVRRSNLF